MPNSKPTEHVSRREVLDFFLLIIAIVLTIAICMSLAGFTLEVVSWSCAQ